MQTLNWDRGIARATNQSWPEVEALDTREARAIDEGSWQHLLGPALQGVPRDSRQARGLSLWVRGSADEATLPEGPATSSSRGRPHHRWKTGALPSTPSMANAVASCPASPVIKGEGEEILRG